MARRHYTIPPSPDQAKRLSDLREIAKNCGCEPRVYDAEGREAGTKTLVMKGDAEALLDAMIPNYLGLEE